MNGYVGLAVQFVSVRARLDGGSQCDSQELPASEACRYGWNFVIATNLLVRSLMIKGDRLRGKGREIVMTVLFEKKYQRDLLIHSGN